MTARNGIIIRPRWKSSGVAGHLRQSPARYWSMFTVAHPASSVSTKSTVSHEA